MAATSSSSTSSSSIGTQLARAKEFADYLVTECAKSPAPAPGFVGGGGVGGQFAQALTGSKRESRNKGWTHTAIRPIANRIAGQTIHVARQRVGAGRDKRAPAGMKSAGGTILRRGVRVPQYSKMPSRFKNKAIMDSDGWEELENHPLLDALNDPNEYMVTWSLIYVTVAGMELTGYSYWWLRNVGGKTQIWPLPKSWVTPVHDPDSDDPRLFARWAIQSPGMTTPEYVDGDDVVAFYYPDPDDPLSGFGPHAAQSGATEIDDMSQRARANLLRNGGLPTHMVIMGDPTDPTNINGRAPHQSYQRDPLIEVVRKMYRNARRNGDPLILDSLVRDVKPLTMPAADVGLDATDANSKNRIMLSHGTNPIVVGEVESSSRAASAMADYHFCGTTVNPKIELLSECMTAWLGPRFARNGENLYVWIEKAEPLDEQRLNWFHLLERGGRVTDNELRDEVNLPPVEGGDQYPPPRAPQVVPSNQQEGQQENQQEQAAARPADNAGSRESSSLLKLPYKKADWLAAYSELWQKWHSETENRIMRALVRYFGARATEIADALLSGAALAAQDLVKVEQWTAELVGIMQPEVTAAMTSGAAGEMAVLGLDVVQIPPGVMLNIRRAIDETMRQPYWRGIAETTRDQLSDVIEQWVAEGEPLRELVDRVEETLGGAGGRERAEAIARTEATGAQNAGHYAAREELIAEGLITGSEWLTQGLDDKVRESHAALEGAVAGAGQMFNVGGYPAPYPGHWSLPAGERCNCRCTTVAAASFADDALDDPTGYSDAA